MSEDSLSETATPELSDALAERLRRAEGTVGVIGLGYVGLPLSLSFTEAGFGVRGFDIDRHRVSRLLSADSYVDDVTDDRLAAGLESGFTPSADPEIVADCDAYIIAVPTGMRDDGPDMAAVEAAAETVAAQSGPEETLVVVSSTVYPGATAELVEPIINERRDTSAHVTMVPERINPGGPYEFEDIPLVVGGNTEVAREAASALFDTLVVETHPVESTDTAELTKTLENTYRMINIALVNELVTLSEGLDADIWDAIDAAATKPFGFQAFRPGPGVGGHCIPVDPQFLTWRANDIGTDVSFIDDAHAVNERMPTLVADRLQTFLRGRGVDISEASIVVLGLSYKPNIGDTRNSPALRILDRLPETAAVTVVDPHVDPEAIAYSSTQSPIDADLAGADVVLLLVDHAAFDLEAVGEAAPFVFDTRNAMPEGVSADVVTLGGAGSDDE
jgi:nucleotide sugar dehydrogenase